ncbi:MAG: hypothetical protein CSA49_05605 [Gammaproteobacteria bacterium]|nr:MAG: hypothetical protein CSA49_05605 [Gammaproteobacteria bacterium]
MENDLKISELREITNLIFDYIQANLNIEAVRLEKDFYWQILDKNLYDPECQPNDFALGQLFDDLEFLKGVLRDKENAVPAMFMHLAPLLIYLSTQVNWYNSK